MSPAEEHVDSGLFIVPTGGANKDAMGRKSQTQEQKIWRAPGPRYRHDNDHGDLESSDEDARTFRSHS